MASERSEKWVRTFVPFEDLARTAFDAGDASGYARGLEEAVRWKKAIEGLTPSGSEFVNDPEYCAAYIRKRTEYPKMIIDLRAELADLRSQLICGHLRANWVDASYSSAGQDYSLQSGYCLVCRQQAEREGKLRNLLEDWMYQYPNQHMIALTKAALGEKA